MKVLFLDVDGVINKKENFNPSNKPSIYPLDAYCAFLVGRIQLETGCEVVLSSSWRHHPDGFKIVSDGVVKLLDKTPMIQTEKEPFVARGKEYTCSIRGDEINAWIKNEEAIGNKIEKYAILDDEDDFYDDQPLFQTTFEDGLTDEIAEQVIEHLNN